MENSIFIIFIPNHHHHHHLRRISQLCQPRSESKLSFLLPFLDFPGLLSLGPLAFLHLTVGFLFALLAVIGDFPLSFPFNLQLPFHMTDIPYTFFSSIIEM
jgi:hypothetical protein